MLRTLTVTHYFFLQNRMGAGVRATPGPQNPESDQVQPTEASLPCARPFPKRPHRRVLAGRLLVFTHPLRHEWDAQRGDCISDLIKATQGGSDSVLWCCPLPQLWYFHCPGLLPPTLSQHRCYWLLCGQPWAPFPRVYRWEGGHRKAICRGLPCRPTWLYRAVLGEDPAPCSLHEVACTAGVDLNPLPESEGKLLAFQSEPGAAWALESGRAREQSWPGGSCQGRRGPPKPPKPPKWAGAGGARPAGAGASVTSPGGPPLSGAEGRPRAFLGPGGSSCIGGWREVPAANQGQAVLTVSSGGRHVKAPQRSWEFK